LGLPSAASVFALAILPSSRSERADQGRLGGEPCERTLEVRARCRDGKNTSNWRRRRRPFVEYDKWIRHRLRALQLKQWKRGSKVYTEMRRLGLSDVVAKQAAVVNKRWWHRAAQLVHAGLTARYYDRIGVPRLAD